jgi:streptogramin lyase
MIALTAVTLALTGCAGFPSASTASAPPAQASLSTIKGIVHGGQNPIAYASLQIYSAGTTGTYGSGATALIPTANAACTAGQSPTCYYAGGQKGCVASSSQTCYTGIVTDANGAFLVTGDYSCTLGTELYITATGGNPGSGPNNSSLLMAGFGLCDNLANVNDLLVNEITTVGTVWALAPFMTDSYNATTKTGYVNIGAPSTNVAGLKQAFADINTLINYQNGSSPGPAPGSGAVVPAGATVPSQEIFAIANALAACVNTTGSGNCTTLFGYTTVNGVAPSDTAGAALNMADYPAVNASNILQMGSSVPPFATTFKTANDLTLAVTYTGNGLNAPADLAVDSGGNVWIANSAGNSVTELAHNGTNVGSSPFTAGTISTPSALAIDTTGNVWIANRGNSTLTELTSAGANVSGSPYSGGGLNAPSAIAFDGLGNLWIANGGSSTVSEFSSAGTALSSAGGYSVSGLGSAVVGVRVNPK